MAQKYFTLLQLNTSIRQHIQKISKQFWIVAEVAAARYRRHYYLELVQKEADSVVAKSLAMLWGTQAETIAAQLGVPLDPIFQQGNKVLINVKVQFHEVHGLSLTVQDVDPSYTLGELEQRRRETIQRLADAALLDRQQQLFLPPVPQRIALITSETAAGFADFHNQLLHNPYGYHIETTLFPASVQGVSAARELQNALNSIDPKAFHAVVMIRGGGSRLDLEAFNDEGLARAIATFPLPVLTGIGHQTDETVADLVAHQALKTPTAVATFLIDRFLHFEESLETIFTAICEVARVQLSEQEKVLAERKAAIAQQVGLAQERAATQLSHMAHNIKTSVRYLLKAEQERLNHLERVLELLDPERIMSKGFSITLLDGVPLKKGMRVKVGDTLETRLGDGLTVRSMVQSIKKKNNE